MAVVSPSSIRALNPSIRQVVMGWRYTAFLTTTEESFLCGELSLYHDNYLLGLNNANDAAYNNHGPLNKDLELLLSRYLTPTKFHIPSNAYGDTISLVSINSPTLSIFAVDSDDYSLKANTDTLSKTYNSTISPVSMYSTSFAKLTETNLHSTNNLNMSQSPKKDGNKDSIKEIHVDDTKHLQKDVQKDTHVNVSLKKQVEKKLNVELAAAEKRKQDRIDREGFLSDHSIIEYFVSPEQLSQRKLKERSKSVTSVTSRDSHKDNSTCKPSKASILTKIPVFENVNGETVIVSSKLLNMKVSDNVSGYIPDTSSSSPYRSSALPWTNSSPKRSDNLKYSTQSPVPTRVTVKIPKSEREILTKLTDVTGKLPSHLNIGISSSNGMAYTFSLYANVSLHLFISCRN